MCVFNLIPWIAAQWIEMLRSLFSGVTMGWLLRLVSGAPNDKGPPTVPVFLFLMIRALMLMFVFVVID